MEWPIVWFSMSFIFFCLLNNTFSQGHIINVIKQYWYFLYYYCYQQKMKITFSITFRFNFIGIGFLTSRCWCFQRSHYIEIVKLGMNNNLRMSGSMCLMLKKSSDRRQQEALEGAFKVSTFFYVPLKYHNMDLVYHYSKYMIFISKKISESWYKWRWCIICWWVLQNPERAWYSMF